MTMRKTTLTGILRLIAESVAGAASIAIASVAGATGAIASETPAAAEWTTAPV